MKSKKKLDDESSKNLRAYVLLVWKVFKRKQEEDAAKSDDELLREEWEKRFK